MDNWIKKLSSSDKIAFSALIVAICSIVLTIWQINSSQNHNKLSVRPLVAVDFHYRADRNEVGLSIFNLGNGPGIIKWASIKINEKRYISWTNLVDYLSSATTETRIEILKFRNIPSGVILKPDLDRERAKVLLFRTNTFSNVIKKLDDTKIEVCYCSLYNDCWLVSSDLLKPKNNSCEKKKYNNGIKYD